MRFSNLTRVLTVTGTQVFATPMNFTVNPMPGSKPATSTMGQQIAANPASGGLVSSLPTGPALDNIGMNSSPSDVSPTTVTVLSTFHHLQRPQFWFLLPWLLLIQSQLTTQQLFPSIPQQCPNTCRLPRQTCHHARVFQQLILLYIWIPRRDCS